ncbi:hypothetical protein LTR53_001623 [Teratosphaeriaceae sp. CCFEE 6253]|nr:hypothetical protein LTR53_001623 [Teratosphaeriaceae sp. CCFEE 6253]
MSRPIANATASGKNANSTSKASQTLEPPRSALVISLGLDSDDSSNDEQVGKLPQTSTSVMSFGHKRKIDDVAPQTRAPEIRPPKRGQTEPSAATKLARPHMNVDLADSTSGTASSFTSRSTSWQPTHSASSDALLRLMNFSALAKPIFDLIEGLSTKVDTLQERLQQAESEMKGCKARAETAEAANLALRQRMQQPPPGSATRTALAIDRMLAQSETQNLRVIGEAKEEISMRMAHVEWAVGGLQCAVGQLQAAAQHNWVVASYRDTPWVPMPPQQHPWGPRG